MEGTLAKRFAKSPTQSGSQSDSKFSGKYVAVAIARLVRTYHVPLVAYALSRVLVLIAIGAGALLNPDRGFRRAYFAWDSGFYTTIASSGYQIGNPPWQTIAFFPGYPIVIRAVYEILPVTMMQAALIVSITSGALATIMMYKIALVVFGSDEKDTADRAAMLFAFFPGSYVLSLTYSEAFTILLAMICLYSLLKQRWLVAGLVAGYASGTRSIALALAVAAAWASMVAIYRRREWRSLIAPALAPVGFITYLVFVHVHTGSYKTWKHVQDAYWHQQTDVLASLRVINRMFFHKFGDLNLDVLVTCIVFVMFAAIVAIATRVKMPMTLWVFVATTLAIVFISTELMPKPRFIFTAFPIVLVLAKGVSKRYYPVLLAVGSCLLGLLACVAMANDYITP